MGDVTFFHHARQDGATRTGLTINGYRALELFEAPGPEFDPTIRWYIDLRFLKQHAPTHREAAINWVFEHENEIAILLQTAAERVGAGVEEVPLTLNLLSESGPVTVVVTASQQAEVFLLESLISQMKSDVWPRFLQSLRPAYGSV
jgi:hypothetical protein